MRPRPQIPFFFLQPLNDTVELSAAVRARTLFELLRVTRARPRVIKHFFSLSFRTNTGLMTTDFITPGLVRYTSSRKLSRPGSSSPQASNALVYNHVI